jgi:hypothetical protein
MKIFFLVLVVRAPECEIFFQNLKKLVRSLELQTPRDVPEIFMFLEPVFAVLACLPHTALKESNGEGVGLPRHLRIYVLLCFSRF